MTQKDIEKLPPRFRKQLQMQQQAPPSQQFASGMRDGAGTTMNGTHTPPMDRSPSHTPPPPGAQPLGKTNEEINLRPGNLRTFTPTFRPNIPSMLPKSSQLPQQMSRQPDVRPPVIQMETPVAPPPVIQPQQITIKKVSSQEKEKREKDPPKPKIPTADELNEEMNKILNSYLNGGETKPAVVETKSLNPPKKYLPEMVSYLILHTLDRSDTDRENVSKLMKAFRDDNIINADQFMDGFNTVLNRMKDLEVEVPLVKSYIAKYAAQAVGTEIITLSELAEPMSHGTHYPLFLLCLQQLHKVRDKNWLVSIFNKSKINLQDMLPECDRKKERMMEILEDRGLSFLFPLLRVQTDLWKQLTTDPTPTVIYKWIKDNVHQDLFKDHGFVKILVSNIIKYIATESTLKEGTDITANPDKTNIEKEKELIQKFKGVLGHFLQDSIELQIVAIYAMQVFVHGSGFPKGMLLRLFMQMYDNEVIDEDAFLRWKEEVNEEFPGKGKALFQVNTWLTWLEQAETDSSEGEEEE